MFSINAASNRSTAFATRDFDFDFVLGFVVVDSIVVEEVSGLVDDDDLVLVFDDLGLTGLTGLDSVSSFTSFPASFSLPTPTTSPPLDDDDNDLTLTFFLLLLLLLLTLLNSTIATGSGTGSSNGVVSGLSFFSFFFFFSFSFSFSFSSSTFLLVTGFFHRQFLHQIPYFMALFNKCGRVRSGGTDLKTIMSILSWYFGAGTVGSVGDDGAVGVVVGGSSDGGSGGGSGAVVGGSSVGGSIGGGVIVAARCKVVPGDEKTSRVTGSMGVWLNKQ